jgi:SAM-dependent methyltransferase
MDLIAPTSGAAINCHEIAAQYLDPPSELPVLDIGAGSGNFTAYLVSHGYKAVALDIDPLDYKQAAWSDAPFVATNLDEPLPIERESAAGAVAIEVLEHLEAPLFALRQMAEAVTVGGFVVITTPNIMSWGSRLELLIRGHHEFFGPYEYATNGHISPLSLVQLTRMAERLALNAEAITYNVGRLPIPRLHQRALTGPRWRRQAFGESLIVKFRKTGPILTKYVRG